ncbi:MAG: DUF4863 family protein [Myxococcota bacterium]
MSDRETFLQALQPVLELVRTISPSDPEAEAKLNRALPPDGEVLSRVRTLMREGVAARWLCDRENAGVRFSRVQKSDGSGLSIDAVHMERAGAGHTHPHGEIDLCFSVEGNPKFDGKPAGWVVYAPNTWHVPTVQGGAMDILYFLPAGAIQFGPKPEGAQQVGLR